MTDENGNINHLEPDPSDFEIDEKAEKEKKKPSYLEGKISSASVFFSFAFVALCFVISSRYWYSLKNLDFYIMQKDLHSSSVYIKSILSVLSHSDLGHFMSNAPLLFIFGVLLHNYYGFLIFPFLSFFSACLIQVLTIYLYHDPTVRLLGASSMLYYMAAVWLVWYFRYEKRKNRTQKTLRVCAFTLVVLFPSTFSPQTSYLGHSLGYVAGIIMAVLLLPIMDKRVASREKELGLF